MTDIGKRLKWLRTEVYDVSQEEIGALVGLKQNTVAKWEGGKGLPIALTIDVLARRLGVTPSFIVAGILDERIHPRILQKIGRMTDEQKKELGIETNNQDWGTDTALAFDIK